jgi:hypothetical protein
MANAPDGGLVPLSVSDRRVFVGLKLSRTGTHLYDLGRSTDVSDIM